MRPRKFCDMEGDMDIQEQI
ncbi:hypothetical protein CKW48_20635, partial [Bordetella pertussis]